MDGCPCSLPDITRPLERRQFKGLELAHSRRGAPIAWEEQRRSGEIRKVRANTNYLIG